MKKPTLPHRASETWPGNALSPATYTSCVATAGGAVFAGGDELRLLTSGTTRFGRSPTPPKVGDVVAVAVDPHQRSRMAAIGLFSIAIFEGAAVEVHDFPAQEFEFEDLAWGPATGGAAAPLYLRTDTEQVMCLQPGESDLTVMDLPPIRAIASDREGRLAFAWFEEEDSSCHVRVDVEPGSDRYTEHTIDAPSTMEDIFLAVAGEAVAVAFSYAEPGEFAQMTRHATREAMVPVELLSGGPVAFQGMGSDAALFGTTLDGNVQGILRIDAAGRATRIGELKVPKSDTAARFRQFAWDESRQTLWTAAGRAGLIASTAPGVTPPWAGGALS